MLSDCFPLLEISWRIITVVVPESKAKRSICFPGMGAQSSPQYADHNVLLPTRISKGLRPQRARSVPHQLSLGTGLMDAGEQIPYQVEPVSFAAVALGPAKAVDQRE
jgi:hypothetical protein